MTTLSNPSWFSEGLGLVLQVFDYFREQMSQGATGIMRVAGMNSSVKIIWEDFVAEKIDEEQVLIRLEIVRPPRRQALKRKMPDNKASKYLVHRSVSDVISERTLEFLPFKPDPISD